MHRDRLKLRVYLRNFVQTFVDLCVSIYLLLLNN